MCKTSNKQNIISQRHRLSRAVNEKVRKVCFSRANGSDPWKSFDKDQNALDVGVIYSPEFEKGKQN